MTLKNETSDNFQWQPLTRMPEKAHAYSADPAARVAISIAASKDLRAALWNLGLLVVKPEALVSGRAPNVARFLDEQALTVVASFETELDAARSHALWSYPWVRATVDRIRLHILMTEGLAARCLLFRRDTTTNLPLSVAMSLRKGSSKGQLRTPDQLRARLGMCNRMIAFVHLPDEPADLLRDLYILGGASAVQLIGAEAQPVDLCWAEAACDAPVKLELTDILDDLPADGRAEILGLLADRHEQGKTLPLTDALRAANSAGASDKWVSYAIAAELISHDRPGVTGAFDACAVEALAERWRTNPPPSPRDTPRSSLSAPLSTAAQPRTLGNMQ